MRLAMRVPERGGSSGADPREQSSAEVIDLASRNAFPLVAARKGRSDALGLAAGVAFVGLLGAVTLWGMNAARTERNQAQPQPSRPLTIAPAPVAVIAPQPVRQPAMVSSPAAAPAPEAVLAKAPQVAAGPAANPYASPTVVFDASGLPVPAGPIAAPGASTGNGAADFASRIGVGGATATAARQFDPQTTVTQGTLIPAVLETAINTDVPGYVRAVVSQDVRSYDGSRVLVPRSSRLIGQYQSGLQAGQKRAYVIWTRLIRPDGVSVDISSPGTDFSGMAGLPGNVNNHFFMRFGSAMLLSVIGGLSTALSGGGALILGGGESAAAAAVQQDSKISPTIKVRQGEPIRVFTARDLDFAHAPQL